MRWWLPYVEQNLDKYGTPGGKEEFNRLREQYHRYAAIGDVRGQTWVYEQIRDLNWKLVQNEPRHWKDQLQQLKSPWQDFVNKEEAKKVLEQADAADVKSDLPALRSACQKLFALQRNSALEQGRDREAQSGLRQG